MHKIKIYMYLHMGFIDFLFFLFQAIVFVFTSFDLDYQPSCTSDSLTILDGDDPTGPPIGTYCGSNTPEVITTSGNAAMLVFITDGSGSNTGFSVNFMAIDQSGGGGGGGPSGSKPS